MNTATPSDSTPVTSTNLRAEPSGAKPTRAQVASAIRAGHVKITDTPSGPPRPASRAERRATAKSYLRGRGELNPARG